MLACDDDNEKDDSDIETNGDPLMDVVSSWTGHGWEELVSAGFRS